MFQEIRELLSDFPVQSVFLQCGTGSGTARAVLEDPELLEEWDKERIFLLRGQRVLVCPSPTDMMLCVARLPTTYTEEHFQALVHTYGKVQCSFLMISEKTGESKGYGFVEYTTKESALQAKNILDGLQVENCALCCDWLDSSHVTFESLHSKCLYVDKLPKDFRDMGEFRKVFSSVVNPPYCQIALKNGCPQDWGLVEFATSEDAETAQTTLNKYSLRGHNIRIMPIKEKNSASCLTLQHLLSFSSFKICPSKILFVSNGLGIAQSLQNIIWTQIQALQNGGENGNKPSPPSTPTLGNSSSVKGKTGLTPPENTTNPPGGTENAQAAMVILLAAQIQTQMGSTQPSLLGNPQMLATLQNLIKQGPPSSTTSVPPPMGPPPARNFHFHPGHITMPEPRKSNTNGQQNGFMKTGQPQKTNTRFGGRIAQSTTLTTDKTAEDLESRVRSMSGVLRVPLLPNPSVGVSPPPVEVTTPVQFSNPTLDNANKKCVMVAPHNNITNPGPSQMAPQDPSTFWTGLLGQIPTHQPPPLGRALMGNPVPMAMPAAKPIGFLDMKANHLQQSPFQSGWNSSAFLSSTPLSAVSAPQFGPYPGAGIIPGLWSHPGSPVLIASPPPGLITPIGQKRKYTRVLPSPEPSPEETMEGIINYMGDSIIWATVDEMTDVEGNFVVYLVTYTSWITTCNHHAGQGVSLIVPGLQIIWRSLYRGLSGRDPKIGLNSTGLPNTPLKKN
uniref:RRM domain-containing protein n=1 Tax=Timema poppense TaxID=170557 RepID=A0A7R9CHW5_TIMPO|nr:unnamed protein product [Timema poppensis]